MMAEQFALRLLRRLDGYRGYVTSVEFSPDGSKIVSHIVIMAGPSTNVIPDVALNNKLEDALAFYCQARQGIVEESLERDEFFMHSCYEVSQKKKLRPVAAAAIMIGMLVTATYNDEGCDYENASIDPSDGKKKFPTKYPKRSVDPHPQGGSPRPDH